FNILDLLSFPTRRSSDLGVNMSYNFITNVVSFDANRLVEAADELSSIPFDQYVKTITLHELGHAIDRPALDASLTRTLDYFNMRDRKSTRLNSSHVKISY